MAEGIFNILAKFPIVGRYLKLPRVSNSYSNMSRPFILSYNGWIKEKTYIYPLRTISKFSKICIATIVESKLSYTYKETTSNLQERW